MKKSLNGELTNSTEEIINNSRPFALSAAQSILKEGRINNSGLLASSAAQFILKEGRINNSGLLAASTAQSVLKEGRINNSGLLAASTAQSILKEEMINNSNLLATSATQSNLTGAFEMLNTISVAVGSVDGAFGYLKNINSTIEKITEISKKINSINNGVNSANTLISNIEMHNELFKEYGSYFNNLNNAVSKSNLISILDSYNLLVESKIDKAQKNPKYFDYINIVQDVTNKKLELVTKLDTISSFDIESGEGENDVVDNNGGSLEKVMIQHLGYALREDTSINLMSEYQKSDFSKILSMGVNITTKITNVNSLYERKYSNLLFEYNKDSFLLGSRLLIAAQNEMIFDNLIGLLFNGLYECSGVSDNRVMKLLPNDNTLVMIKKFRAYKQHSSSHSSSDNLSKVIEVCKNVLGKSFPEKSKDWIKLQVYLYSCIDNMLDELIRILDE